jgi:hypothetical protein
MLRAAIVALSLAAAQPSSVTIAVDGGSTLQPIARVTGTEWTSPPPGPLPRTWTRWFTDGTSSRAAVSSARTAACLPVTPKQRSGAVDVEQVGIAVSGGTLTVAQARRIQAGSREWDAIQPAIRRVYVEGERGQRLSAANLAAFPVSIERVYATPAGTTPEIYYFEASKRVPDPRVSDDPEDPAGTLRIIVAGWLRGGATGLATLGSKSELRWEQDDRRSTLGAGELVPLGLVRHAGRYAWVMNSPGVRRGAFTVYDTPPAGVRTLVRADAGACGA